MAEVIVYQSIHSYVEPQKPPFPVLKTKGVSRLKRAAYIIGFLGFIFLISPYVSSYIYSASSQNAKFQDLDINAIDFSNKKSLPPIDPSLSPESRIKITKIGVDAQIYTSADEKYEDALRKGVWKPIEFGKPNGDKPMILVAHRFGYLAWDNAYRRKNSFYYLPELEKGDKVEVIWHQRELPYEVYEVKKGTEVTDYNADLILYTCNDLFSNLKVFVYAKYKG